MILRELFVRGLRARFSTVGTVSYLITFVKWIFVVGAAQEGEGGEIEERFLSTQAGAFAGANAKEKAPARFARNDSVGCCDLVGLLG